MTGKIKWKQFRFVPEDAPPDAKGIVYGDEGYLYLCNELYERRPLPGYCIHDTQYKPGGHVTSVTFDFKGFREALFKERYRNPRKPSIFYPSTGRDAYENMVEKRRRMLWAVIREYAMPGELAMDILTLLAHGPDEDMQAFVASVYRRQEMIVLPAPFPPPPPKTDAGSSPAGQQS